MVIGKRLLDDSVKATFEVTDGWLKIEPENVELKTITVSETIQILHYGSC